MEIPKLGGWGPPLGNFSHIIPLFSLESVPYLRRSLIHSWHTFCAAFFYLPSFTDVSLHCTLAFWEPGFPVFKCGRWFTPLPLVPPGANGLNHHLARPVHAPPKVHVVSLPVHTYISFSNVLPIFDTAEETQF